MNQILFFGSRSNKGKIAHKKEKKKKCLKSFNILCFFNFLSSKFGSRSRYRLTTLITDTVPVLLLQSQLKRLNYKRYKLLQNKEDILGYLLQSLEPFLPWFTAISFELTVTASTAPFRVAALLLRPRQVRRKKGDRCSLSRKRGI